MARFSVDGLSEIIDGYDMLARTSQDVLDEMAKSGGEILMNGQMVQGMAMGVHDTGQTLNSIKVKKPKGTGDGTAVDITFEGKNDDGNRNAEVAFINEYGKRGQPARPFIRTANEKYEDQAVEAAEKVYHKHIDSKGL